MNIASIFAYPVLREKFPEVYRMLKEHSWLPGTPGFTLCINEVQLYTLIKSTTNIDLVFNDDTVPYIFELAPMTDGISTNYALCLKEVNEAYKTYKKGD